MHNLQPPRIVLTETGLRMRHAGPDRADTAQLSVAFDRIASVHSNAARWSAALAVCAATALALSGCSSATPFGIVYTRHAPKSAPEAVYRGVVNGLWQYDPPTNQARLQGPFCEADEDDAIRLSGRYQVRVGIDRGIVFGEFSEVVLLPEGWKYSTDEIINDGRTVNVGDVVVVHLEPAKGLRTVTDIVRKCDQAPTQGENKDWSIGCKRISSFQKNGYGGEIYRLTGF